MFGKSKEQINAIKRCIGNVCREQALAHRRVAEVADNLASLTELVSLPILVKVISATMRPTVAIKIPEVDDMIARAQAKVDAIKQAKQKVGELRPIDEVVFAQNAPKYNPEWEHSPNGRATSYLATLVCRYMHELQQKDKKVVLSAKALEMIYHTASSSIGKLILGKNTWVDTPSNKYTIRWKWRGRSYLSERKRSYHKDCQALRGQVVAQWSIEKRRMT